MRAVSIHDKNSIERFLRKNVYLHLYGIGDLDDFLWPYTVWFGCDGGSDFGAVATLYTRGSVPTLLAFSEQTEPMQELLESVMHLLPGPLHAHLSPGLESLFGEDYEIEPHGEHYKMALQGEAAVASLNCTEVERLRTAHLDELLKFYEQSYPGNWFDPRMLETNQYFGIREGRRLVSVAGVHVYSPEYRVAALGNIATLPSCRGNGYATKVTAKVCQSLAKDVAHIGLNVKTDNRAAISCYRRLGFEVVASFGEFTFKRK
jgi:ribosomal protein S18 acetylase RimI-like enzyme